jgi:hypothetical protein
MALYLDASLRRTALPVLAAARTYIRSWEFDATLLLVPLGTALMAALAVIADPSLYTIVLLADLWLLGYHHVVATYTRLAFDTQSLRRNRFLAVDLLVLVMMTTLVVAMTAGAWVIATAFLYLQWFHYTRQSYGIARMYYRATPEGRIAGSRDLATDLVIYLVPLYAIAARSSTMGNEFLGFPVKAIVLPEVIVTTLGIAAAGAVVAWVVKTARAAVADTLDLTYTSYIISHVGVFLVAYIVVDDVNVGWLAINVWHNFQYVLVVWMSNAKRYAGGIDPAARFLSRISQPGRVTWYFVSCLSITTIVYLLLNRFTVLVLGGGLAITAGVYMGINFHHYVVDALIWKRRKAVPQGA